MFFVFFSKNDGIMANNLQAKYSMKYILFFLLSFVSIFKGQYLSNIASGEVLSYRIHYGFFNAGTATLSTQIVNYKNTPHLYVRGVGRTTGAVNAFFRVEDLYESYISYDTGLPSFYVRNVQEGSYKQHLETTFHHENTTLSLMNKRENTPKKIVKSIQGVQDMLSAFYHLRGLDAEKLRIGSVHNINIWIDDEMFPFQIRVAGTEMISTKFGKINCIKIIPLVKSGRVFKEKEGVTLWVSNDKNHVPIAISAKLLVGSLRADLSSYKNVKYPLNFSK